MEGLCLRVKDVDFDRHIIIVRDGKGGKHRVVMLLYVLKVAAGGTASPLDSLLPIQ